jgi:hypothetical protein
MFVSTPFRSAHITGLLLSVLSGYDDGHGFVALLLSVA